MARHCLPRTVRAFEEFVTLLDLLLRHSRTSWGGSHFCAVDARTIPGLVQRPRPPFVIAGNGAGRPALPRSNLAVLRNGLVTKVIVESGAAAGLGFVTPIR